MGNRLILTIKDLVDICRPNQWYKNLVIFIAIFFLEEIFIFNRLYAVFLGFVSLCLISSVSYIINDIKDRKKDLLNNEKKNRPIACGRIKTFPALLFSLFLFLVSVLVASYLGLYFVFCIIGLFFMMMLYTFYLKKEVFMDIIGIAVNFVLRAVSGSVILGVSISPWLIIGTFFLSLFLSTGKRISESNHFSQDFRPTLKYYTPRVTQPLITASTTILILSFSFYSFLSNHSQIIFVLPLFVYVVLRYVFLIESGSIIARRPELIYKDKQFFVALILSLAVTSVLVYLL
jgi:4-hydroxybenzoate polyprenyltransferase